MKKLFFTTSAGLIFFLLSCNEKPPVEESNRNSTTYKNLEVTRAVNKAFGSGDVTELDSLIADSYIDHTDRGDIKGRDSLKAMIKMVHAVNKEMKMDIIKELADDDYVFTWARFSGISDGSMMPAGAYNMTAIEVTRMEKGKVVEHWEFMEPREMMKLMPALATDPKAKTN